MENKTNLLLIYNPKAGKDNIRPSLRLICSQFPNSLYDIDSHVTCGPDDCERIVKQNAQNYDAIVVCGGDGTVMGAVNGIISTGLDIPIGYIPIGSTNDFAATLGIPTDFRSAAKLICSKKSKRYDAGLFNGKAFSYVACFGPGTNVSYNTTQKMKNKIGYNAYMLNGFALDLLSTLRNVKPKHIKIECDGDEMDGKYFFGAVSNALSVAGMFHYDKDDVKLDDGKFEVILVKDISNPLQLFSMLYKIIHRKYDGQRLLYFKASSLKMSFDSGDGWSLDGEYGGSPDEVEIKVLPRAIRVYSENGEN